MATLRAGIPLVVSPLMGDQFFWVKLLQAKGLVGSAGGGASLPTMTSDQLVTAIQQADSEEYVTKAREFGQHLRKNQAVLGVDQMFKVLDRATKEVAFFASD